MTALGVSDEKSAMFVLGKEQFLLRFDSFYFAEVPSVTTLIKLRKLKVDNHNRIRAVLNYMFTYNLN